MPPRKHTKYLTGAHHVPAEPIGTVRAGGRLADAFAPFRQP